MKQKSLIRKPFHEHLLVGSRAVARRMHETKYSLLFACILGSVIRSQANNITGLGGSTGQSLVAGMVTILGQNDANKGGDVRVAAGDSYTFGGKAILKGGEAMAGKGGDVEVDGGGGYEQFGNVFLNPDHGRVAIGNRNPQARLDVNGSIRVGEDTRSCTQDISGSIKFTNGCFQGCDGHGRVSLGGGNCAQ